MARLSTHCGCAVVQLLCIWLPLASNSGRCKVRQTCAPCLPAGRNGATAASLLARAGAGAQQHFQRLVQQYRGRPRPPRRCPCGSGELYLECHAER